MQFEDPEWIPVTERVSFFRLINDIYSMIVAWNFIYSKYEFNG